MNARFADTSYWLALLIPNDENHDRAVELAKQWQGPLLTTDWVLVEVGNHLSPPRSRQVFVRFMRSIESSSRMKIVMASQELLHKGLAIYEARPDKRWSLTDCISIAVMGDNVLTEALTGDHHFEQAGFRILM